MLFMFVFGNTLEKMIGRDYHLMVFFVGGFTAFLLPPALGIYAPDTGMLGASAAIFTLAACVMLMNPLKFSFLFMAPQGLVAIFYFAYNLIIVTTPAIASGLGYDPSIAYIAHIIGFTVGIPFGIAWGERWKRNLLVTLGLFAIYLAIIALLATFFGLGCPSAYSSCCSTRGLSFKKTCLVACKSSRQCSRIDNNAFLSPSSARTYRCGTSRPIGPFFRSIWKKSHTWSR